MTQASDVVSRPRQLRRDAAENRELLLAAAAQVFAEVGLGAGVEEIARVAGVGVGTLYRRFPTKEALIAELVQDVLEKMSVLAEQAVAAPDGRGLEQFLESSSAYQAEHRGCLPKLWHTSPDNEAVVRVRRTIAALLAEAKRHGQVREDITATDLTMLMWSIRGVIETTRDVAPEAWRRHLALLVAGLRPAGTPLGHRPLTRAQVDQVLADPT
ncbi:MAG TPA: helix-turn-helix domain-containing protein [Mycobacteriales bacterium]|nr:helix-turn-helix domain-containing protein [Mycobacteriales bacterium]